MMNRVKKIRNYLDRENVAGYLFTAPSILLFCIFTFFPLLSALVLGFFDFDLFFDLKFIGLDNFKELFQDPYFWKGLRVTLVYTLFEAPLQLIISLVAAVYVSKFTKYRKILRSIYFLPVVCSMTAIGIVFIYVLNPYLSPFLYLVYMLTGETAPSLLTGVSTALPTVIGVTLWKNFGYTMVILVAAIQAIPTVYEEAAQIDGANSFQRFWKITLPLIRPSLNFCLLITLIGAMQAFDQMFILTDGGPVYETQTLVMYTYTTGFQLYPFRVGYAAAMAEILFVIITIFSVFIRKFLMSKEESLT